MPGLPIVSRLATLAIPAMLALIAFAAGPAMAQPKQPSVETLMYHMTQDHDVTKARKQYGSAVQAAMLYSQCPTQYRVDDDKRARANKVLGEADRALRVAFSVAHQKLTNKLPANATNQAITHYIADLQKKEAVSTGLVIKSQKNGCTQASLKRVDKFYEAKYAYELQQQAAQAAAEEKRRQVAPEVVESKETKSH